ncbi:MAG: ATP synthase F0 subunit B [Elusimicrobia bacterium RIFOXYB2_FULL_49_7]|nr:MAG: ATP synthase F0 subunit B [Elusimicrobia bacterium RIFOXYB2_FULL_49_7]
MALWTWIVFIAVLLLLRKFAWKPILSALDEREKKIKQSLEDAAEAKRVLDETISQQKDILGKAQEEAIQMVQRSRETAQNVAMEIEKKAMHEAERMIEGARNAIQGEKARAVAELRKEAATLAVMVAGKLISENLDDERNQKLSERYIHEITG